MKKIYFVRHGESKANVERIAAGAEFDSPLTKNGEAQAIKMGEVLKDKKVDLIISSPLKRAVKTAEIIALEIGYNPKKIITNQIFIERGLGIYAKRPISDFATAYEKGVLHKSVETAEDLVNRVARGIEWLASQKANEIIVVSHSDVNGALRLIHQKLPNTHLYELEELGNAKMYEFTI